METLQERNNRIRHLEEQRAARRADIGTVWPTPDDAGLGGISPVEIAPGRGDLNIMSGFYPSFPTALQMVGRTVSFARLFMSQPLVGAAVMWMLTKAIRVPLKVYRKMGDDPADRKELQPGDHPLADAIHNPYNRGSSVDLVMGLLGPQLVHGNSVSLVEMGRSKMTITPKDWRFCRPIMPFRDTIEGFVFDYDQVAYKNEASIDKVLHLKYWSPGGPIGCSPLQQLGVTLQIEDALQRWQRAMLANGARPPSAITMSDEFLGMDPAKRVAIMGNVRKDIDDLYTGPEQAGKPALLPPGLDWKPVGQTMVEAELVNQRKVDREEVCIVYLIPPPLLGILDRATYSNIQVQRDMTYTDCLGPPLVMVESTINAQIARDFLQDPDVYCAFDFGAVLRGDPLQEIELLRQAVGTALITPNEGRGVLKLKKSDDPAMDRFYVPANNMQPIGSPPTPGMVPGGTPEQMPDTLPPDPQRGKRLHVRTREGEFIREFEGAGV